MAKLTLDEIMKIAERNDAMFKDPILTNLSCHGRMETGMTLIAAEERERRMSQNDHGKSPSDFAQLKRERAKIQDIKDGMRVIYTRFPGDRWFEGVCDGNAFETAAGDNVVHLKNMEPAYVQQTDGRTRVIGAALTHVRVLP